MSKLPKPYSIVISLSLKPRFILFSLFSLLISIKILLVTHNFQLNQPTNIINLDNQSLVLLSNLSTTPVNPPEWLEVIQANYLVPNNEISLRVGFINFEVNQHQESRLLVSGIDDLVTIDLEHVASNVTWDKLFPEVMDNNSRCPEIPMPNAREYPTLDVVVARLPCGEGYNRSHTEGVRDVHRLQLSLASAHLIVESAIRKNTKNVYGVFISKCEPMLEIFRCDDLIWHQEDYWIYKPNVEKLKEIISTPFGTCELARPYVATQAGNKEHLEANSVSKQYPRAAMKSKQAYVTILHSSEAYVCGAIALAQSILLTNTTKDLVLLADETISNHSIMGLQAVGWKIKWIERIRSPYAKNTAYNAWNYSKLRMWQLIEYSKVMFIDSDFIVLRNLDHFFNYPPVSARSDHEIYFNSGMLIIEPSECLFKTLMNNRFTLMSYNGGDQGYVNEVFTYWHRLSRNMSSVKLFSNDVEPEKRVVPMERYAIHFFGIKPWRCSNKEHDCNWDKEGLRIYASDQLHAWWWRVYDTMPKQLQIHCKMT